MQFRILTSNRVVLEQNVEAVYAVDPDGRFGILPNHVPTVRQLEIGVLCYIAGGVKHSAALMGGILYTDGNEVVIFADAAELSNEIDVLRAEHSEQRAKARL